jgi:ElaB/YqjD/DUF883 family membrane-anchored ribosome-binding protein
MSNENNPTGPAPGTTQSQSKVESTKSHLKQAADDLRAAAEAKADEFRHRAEDAYGQARQRAEEYYDEARARAEQAYGQARERARTFQEDGEAYVRQNPLKAVCVALGAGFLLGLMFRR